MAFNGSGLFVIDSTGQPVSANTLIESADFNALTADLATGLSNCVTKDGQTTVTANLPMAGHKLTGLGNGTASGDALHYGQIGTDIQAYWKPGEVQDFRLTLTTGVPVTTADVTAAGTIYCAPYKGNAIALYDGTKWNVRTSAEFSLALSGLTSGKPYDIFCYDNAGTPTLEFLVWTNDTTRATALAYQDGVLVKSGAATRRYMGTFYTTGTTTTEDSEANRYLWNYYHRIDRPMSRFDATSSWTYTTATFRQANASSANQLNFVLGVSEDSVSADIGVSYSNSTANVQIVIGLGLDSTSSPNMTQTKQLMYSQVAGILVGAYCRTQQIVSAGRHYISWLEYSAATGTTTWYGAGNSGMIGVVRG